ncbi:MAG: hypothetical protein F4X64_03030 [Chloroflexi bacterium]|nr:hypothetical protein [Chloroflexota bacterium]
MSSGSQARQLFLEWAQGLYDLSRIYVDIQRPNMDHVSSSGRFVGIGPPAWEPVRERFSAEIPDQWNATWIFPVSFGSGRVQTSPAAANDSCWDLINRMLAAIAEGSSPGLYGEMGIWPSGIEETDPWGEGSGDADREMQIMAMEIHILTIGWRA